MTRNEEDFSRCRAWREIDLDALALNAAALQAALAPGCRLMAVLKADAYGHGALLAAQRLYRERVRDFAVACLEEGIQLRRQGLQHLSLCNIIQLNQRITNTHSRILLLIFNGLADIFFRNIASFLQDLAQTDIFN